MLTKINYNEITAFVVGNSIYRVIATKHGREQMRVRNINEYHVASACLGLGRKLDAYNNSGKHVMITDEGKKFTLVFAIENGNIVLITVIDSTDVWVRGSMKNNTIVETFNVG